MRARSWTLAAVLAAWTLPPQTAPPAPVRSMLELVSLPVVVLDRRGEPVPGLAAGDFDVSEDGVRQTIVSFAAAFSPSDVPLYLGVMMDKSVSMERDLPAAVDAAIRFVSAFEQPEDVTLVEVERTVRLSRFAPSDYARLFERLRSRTVGWGTAFYDGVARYVEHTRSRHGIHVLVAYTDGGDSMSDLNLSDVIRLLRGGRVWFYGLGYVEHQGATRLAQQAILQGLARETGGATFFPGSPKDLDRVYRQIRQEIAGRYMLGYVSTNAARDGRFRKVHVRLAGSPRRDVTVRTRSGYLAPDGPS
jgi:Ca-activated chloride channel family protein